MTDAQMPRSIELDHSKFRRKIAGVLKRDLVKGSTALRAYDEPYTQAA